jgi:dimethylargininase
MPFAITRGVSPRFSECELTHIERQPIDIDLARAEHQEYTRALEALGCQVVELPAQPEYPDSVFVEDTAFILPEAAVITRPGAPSRRGEVETIAENLCPFRSLVSIQAPATLDGGDVLVMGKDIFIGRSTRSGDLAIEQLQHQLERFGYRVQGVDIRQCLHLKSAVTRLSDDAVLINREWVDAHAFSSLKMVEVAPSEPAAANILMINDQGIYPLAFPKTIEKLEKLGVKLITLDLSEIGKAEGAVTCCSLII